MRLFSRKIWHFYILPLFLFFVHFELLEGIGETTPLIQKNEIEEITEEPKKTLKSVERNDDSDEDDNENTLLLSNGNEKKKESSKLWSVIKQNWRKLTKKPSFNLKKVKLLNNIKPKKSLKYKVLSKDNKLESSRHKDPLPSNNEIEEIAEESTLNEENNSFQLGINNQTIPPKHKNYSSSYPHNLSHQRKLKEEAKKKKSPEDIAEKIKEEIEKMEGEYPGIEYFLKDPERSEILQEKLKNLFNVKLPSKYGKEYLACFNCPQISSQNTEPMGMQQIQARIEVSS
uniref:Uncharacterized protein n=1 Tax=Meloidogyne hapla TaxID=6305 RepID=A0A1I8BNW8_MELHA